jgi:hypothetical protein
MPCHLLSPRRRCHLQLYFCHDKMHDWPNEADRMLKMAVFCADYSSKGPQWHCLGSNPSAPIQACWRKDLSYAPLEGTPDGLKTPAEGIDHAITDISSIYLSCIRLSPPPCGNHDQAWPSFSRDNSRSDRYLECTYHTHHDHRF